MTKDTKNKALHARTEGGKRSKREAAEAHPDMHALKNSMRRKGLSESSIFHHALKLNK